MESGFILIQKIFMLCGLVKPKKNLMPVWNAMSKVMAMKDRNTKIMY